MLKSAAATCAPTALGSQALAPGPSLSPSPTAHPGPAHWPAAEARAAVPDPAPQPTERAESHGSPLRAAL
eukprot:75588-Rhodomonas_salina.1